MSDTQDPVLTHLDNLRGEFRRHVDENTSAHGAIATALASITSELERHGTEERKMRKAIFGNGEPGLDESMRNIVRFQDTIKRFLWILVPAVVIGALSMVWNASLHYMETVK